MKPGPRATTSACRSRNRVCKRGTRAPGEDAALLAQVPHRVLGELLECLGDARAACSDRRLELVLRQDAAARQAGAVAEEAAPAHGHELAVADGVEELGAGRVDQADAAADEHERARVRVAAALRRRDVDDHADARLDELLGRDAVEVGVVDDRDVVRREALDEVLRALVEAGAPGELDERRHRYCTCSRNSRPPSIRSSSSRRSSSASAWIVVCVGSPGTFSTTK